MTVGRNLPENRMCDCAMFYFNIKGSTNKKDVKLVAFLRDTFAYFDNDITNTWQRIHIDNFRRFKWTLEINRSIAQLSCDFWVCIIIIIFFFVRICVKMAK